jgi:two-component system nitrogen regulation response regulator GlnG
MAEMTTDRLDPVEAPALRRNPNDITHDEVERAMRDNKWQPGAAARQLKIPRTTLYDLIEKHPTLRLATDLTDEQLAVALKECDGDVGAAAKALRVSRRSLQLQLTRVGVQWDADAGVARIPQRHKTAPGDDDDTE